MRLQVVSSNSTYYWSVTNAAPAKPYLQISNQYLPLTTATRSGVKLKIQSGNATYRAAVYESGYYNTTSNAVGNLSSTTALTRASTSGTTYLTRASTSGTNYGTRASTSGTTYLTRASTSGTNYGTRASTSAYLTRASTSGTSYGTRASTSGYLTRASTSGTNYGTRSSLVSTAPAILLLSSKSELQGAGVKGAIVQVSLANITYSTSTILSQARNSTSVLLTYNLSNSAIRTITYTKTATNGYPGGNKTYTGNMAFAKSTSYTGRTAGKTYATPPLPMDLIKYTTINEAHGGSVMQVYVTYSSVIGAFSSTRASTSGTTYLTRASTSGYLTRASTSGTTYLTRASTSGTNYGTRASTSGYSGKLSSSKWG